MSAEPVILITGTSKGIGRFLAEYYLERGFSVVGCSRGIVDLVHERYTHHVADVCDEKAVKSMFSAIRKAHRGLDILINNAGIASMNHMLLTPMETAERILRVNVLGTFLLCRESAKLMRGRAHARIVNFTTVASPLQLEGEALYAASKAAVERLTEILGKEIAELGITVNAVGPTPIRTDLIRGVPREKLEELLGRQAIRRFGEFEDVANVIDFFIRPESDFVTSQIVYLGGVH